MQKNRRNGRASTKTPVEDEIAHLHGLDLGGLRRECVDHIIVLGEVHLRQILKSYARYYNDIRTHRSLDKDAPVTRQIQRIGSIKSHAILGGLHHHYARA
jgi:hypothetical protein